MDFPTPACSVPMIQQLEATLRAGAVPQAPQFKPSSFGQAAQSATANSNPSKSSDAYSRSPQEKTAKKEEANKEAEKVSEKLVSPAVETVDAKDNSAVLGDPLGNARKKVQDEIAREFAAIMASGTLRASEAAALATRKVMQRYGHTNIAMPSN